MRNTHNTSAGPIAANTHIHAHRHASHFSTFHHQYTTKGLLEGALQRSLPRSRKYQHPRQGTDQRWASTQASRQIPDTDLIPDIRSKGVKYRIFSKNQRQRSCPLPRSFRSLTNSISRDRIFHFQLKENRDLYLDFLKCLNEVSNN